MCVSQSLIFMWCKFLKLFILENFKPSFVNVHAMLLCFKYIFDISSGYFRIITCVLAMYYALDNWILAASFYTISQGLDAVDGTAARYYNQSTKFGQVIYCNCHIY